MAKINFFKVLLYTWTLFVVGNLEKIQTSTGWWFLLPWKIWKSDWIIIPTIMEKNVPNHQPVKILSPFGDGVQELSIEVTRLVQPASASFDISTVGIPRCLVTLSSKYVVHVFSMNHKHWQTWNAHYIFKTILSLWSSIYGEVVMRSLYSHVWPSEEGKCLSTTKSLDTVQTNPNSMFES